MKMRQLLRIPLVMLLTLSSFTGTLLADPIDTQGEWDPDERIRTAPSTPLLSIEGKELQIYFPQTLSDLTVCIKSLNGITIHSSVIQGVAGETVSVAINQAQCGEYSVLLTHQYGWLMGEFTID